MVKFKPLVLLERLSQATTVSKALPARPNEAKNAAATHRNSARDQAKGGVEQRFESGLRLLSHLLAKSATSVSCRIMI